jgi:nucleoside-diphosphate-sugar epimerase
MSKSKVCITGANGRVGRELVGHLSRAGHQVIGLVRSESAARVVEQAGGQAVVAQLSETSAVASAISGATWLFHLAGTVRGPGKETPEVVNHQGTRHLVEALSSADRGNLKAIVFTSTVAIYGDRSGLWVEEDMPPRPETDYGRSKVAAERALLDAPEALSLPCRIVRLAAVYGPGFPFMMVDRMQTGKAWLPGEGMNYIPTIHVEDAVRAMTRVAEQGQNGRIYNLADREPLQLKEFYSTVQANAGGTPVRFWSTWIPSYVQERVARRNESLKARLGRKPNLTVDALRLYTASSRMNIQRLETELDFEWLWPDPVAGIADSTSS